MEQYFSELSSPIRIQILQILQQQPMGLSKITKQINNISNSEVSRHLSRLSERNFIKKDSETGRNYTLTDFGKMIIELIQPILYLFSNENYFSTHSILDLPSKFHSQIHCLRKAEIISGTGNVMLEFQKYMSLPTNYVRVMVDSPFPFGNPNNDVDYICAEKMKSMKPEFGEIKKRFRFKFLPETPISITFNNLDIGFIIFPLIGASSPDFSVAFKISDSKGIHFIKEIWKYFWDLEENYILIDSNHPPPTFN